MSRGRPRAYGPSPWPDCGTSTGRRRHYSRGEKPCPECAPGRSRSECGTPGGQRRHYRDGEKPCQACRLAANQAQADRKGWAANVLIEDPRPVRNELPETVPYRYREHRYPWALRVLANAEAAWGRPEDEEAA